MIWELGQDAAEESISLLRGALCRFKFKGCRLVQAQPGLQELKLEMSCYGATSNTTKVTNYIQLFHCLRCLTRIHYISSKALGMTRLRGLFVIVSFFIHRIPPMFHCVAALATADLACLAQLGHTRNRSKLQVFQCSLRVVAVPEGLPKKLT